MVVLIVAMALTVIGMGSDDRSGILLTGLGVVGCVVALVMTLIPRSKSDDPEK